MRTPTRHYKRLITEVSALLTNKVFLSLERLAGGLITALMALFLLIVLIATALLSLLGIGLLVLPMVLRQVSIVADRERHRLTWWGLPVALPAETLRLRTTTGALTAMLKSRRMRRDLTWLAAHASIGLAAGLVGVMLPVLAIRDSTFPLWWWAIPGDLAGASIGVPVRDWYGAAAVGLLGVGWWALTFGLSPVLAGIQSWPGRVLLSPRDEGSLEERITHLTSTRTAALEWHTAELRRIERSLHDGAQSRLVAVVMQVGSAQRALKTNAPKAEQALEQAFTAAQDALAELRSLVRGILPPALESHDLEGAIDTLTLGCSVPCAVRVGRLGELRSSIEATAYSIVAEAITNITKHSGAARAEVLIETQAETLHIQVRDDGRGGAVEGAGSGLTGIRQRVELHGGTFHVDSPPGGPTTIRAELPCK
ncbi:MAG: sensor domain-containing protein [Propionibacteriaceae bacterium]|nr:sensor domain-containing protein [Propionibacteriaceae bacterium]